MASANFYHVQPKFLFPLLLLPKSQTETTSISPILFIGFGFIGLYLTSLFFFFFVLIGFGFIGYIFNYLFGCKFLALLFKTFFSEFFIQGQPLKFPFQNILCIYLSLFLNALNKRMQGFF